MAARLIQIEGSAPAPWQGRCVCGWNGAVAATRDEAIRQADRHRRDAHPSAAVLANRVRRHRLNAAP